MEKNEQEEPLIQKEQYKAKKKIIIIILTILGVALTIGAFVYIAIIVQEKYDNEEDKKENITEKFEYGLTLEELENRTSPGHLGKLIYLKKDSKEYKDLEDGDKTALKYLTKAAVIMDEVFLRIFL